MDLRDITFFWEELKEKHIHKSLLWNKQNCSNLENSTFMQDSTFHSKNLISRSLLASLCVVFVLCLCVWERVLCGFSVFDLWSDQNKHGIFQPRNEATLLHKTPHCFYPSMHWDPRRSVPSFLSFLHSSVSPSCFHKSWIRPTVAHFSPLWRSLLQSAVCFAIMTVSMLKLR